MQSHHSDPRKTVAFSAMNDGSRQVFARRAYAPAISQTGVVKGLPPA